MNYPFNLSRFLQTLHDLMRNTQTCRSLGVSKPKNQVQHSKYHLIPYSTKRRTCLWPDLLYSSTATLRRRIQEKKASHSRRYPNITSTYHSRENNPVPTTDGPSDSLLLCLHPPHPLNTSHPFLTPCQHRSPASQTTS